MDSSKTLLGKDISRIISFMQPVAEDDLTSTYNYFSDGVYVREILIKAGSVVVGKKHSTRHLNILISGKLMLWTIQGKEVISGPCTFESLPGVQKVVYCLTDVVYMTIHPTDERDLNKLEGQFVCPVEQMDLFPELDALPLFPKELEYK